MAKELVNNSIKIPDQHFVGFQVRGQGHVPLGFMTPEGTDKTAERRKSTVKSWSSKTIPTKTIDNEPLIGFKVGQSINHSSSWNRAFDKWRVEDPRGFELEISSGNFENIIKISTIENGEILEKCVWGRLGSENILIPVGSEIYKSAVSNTERAKQKIAIKDVNIGNKVILKNGDKITFLGRVKLYTQPCDIDHDLFVIDAHKTKMYAILDENNNLDFKSSLEVSLMDDDNTIIEAEAEKIINEKVSSFSNYGAFYKKKVVFATFSKMKYSSLINPSIDIEEFDIQEQMTLKYNDEYHNTFFGFNNDLIYGYINTHQHNSGQVNGSHVDYKELIDNHYVKFIYRTDNSNSYWRREPTKHISGTPTKCYRINLVFTLPSGDKAKQKITAR